MNNLIGIGGIVYGLGFYTLVQSGVLNIPLNWPQIGVAVIGGIVLLIWNNYSYLTSFKLPKIESKGKIYKPDSPELKDFDCLIHLRGRVLEIGSPEGLESLNKLNSILFINEKSNIPIAVNSKSK